jgi:excisionase family DNA binding protein
MLGVVIPEPKWAATVPAEQIPAVLIQLTALQSALAARLLECVPVTDATEPFVDAAEMAKQLGIHESWVRTEQRAGRIPFRQVGRYIRFEPAEVKAAIAAGHSRPLT